MPRVKHLTTVPDARTAVAPYNFVPLPETIIPVDAEPPPHDRYDTTRQTGRIECRLVTETPLYVRCPLTCQQFAQGERERGQRVTDFTRLAKNAPEFFYTCNQEKPVVPGSSLRGMLRSLVEIAAFAKMDRVTRRKPFFRALADETLRDLYQRAFVTRVPHSKIPPHPCYQANIRTGFLRSSDDRYYIEECEHARIDHNAGNRLGLAAIPTINGKTFRSGRIDWDWQHRTIYVVADPEKVFTDHVLGKAQEDGTFENIPRIRALRALLRWPGPLPSEQYSRSMQIERDKEAAHQLARTRFRYDRRRNRDVGNEYTPRPVLPGPEQVLSQAGVPLSGTARTERSGRLSNNSVRTQSPAQRASGASPAQPADPTSAALAAFVQSVRRSNAGSLPNLIHQWRTLDPRMQRAAAEEMVAYARAIKVKGLADKPWFRELDTYLGASSNQ